MTEVRIATRRSPLALAQARRVADLISRKVPDVEVTLLEVETAGDRDQAGAIAALTEVGAFVRAVQAAVLEDRADLAVHSLKDLPVTGPEDLVLAAFPERVTSNDVMVGSALDDLPPGGVVGTGSPRRSAQLALLRPDLRTTELRGNIDTRLRKVADGTVHAAVLAEAGLERLDRIDAVAQRFTFDEMVPAPGQGAIAVETRKESSGFDVATAIDDPDLRLLLNAERVLLAETGAGCRSALGAVATNGGGGIELRAFVADDRGPRHAAARGSTPGEVAAAVHEELGL